MISQIKISGRLHYVQLYEKIIAEQFLLKNEGRWPWTNRNILIIFWNCFSHYVVNNNQFLTITRNKRTGSFIYNPRLKLIIMKKILFILVFLISIPLIKNSLAASEPIAVAGILLLKELDHFWLYTASLLLMQFVLLVMEIQCPHQKTKWGHIQQHRELFTFLNIN